MSRRGRIDFRGLVKLRDSLEKIQGADCEKFCEDTAKNLASRLLTGVVKATPTGIYPASSGKVGGTLKRGWSVSKPLNVVKNGICYEIEIVNPVHYAPYVEYGHRTVNGKGWVPGHFMLTKNEMRINRLAPGIVEKRLIKFLGECFNGN